MIPTSLEILTRAAGCSRFVQGEITEISTDTRSLAQGCLFVALRGERFNGHDYVAQALQKGAAWAVVDGDCAGVPPDDGRLLYVQDTQQALIDMAGAYRSLFQVRCVGVTGSVGKTTTKDMIAAAISSGFCTLKTQGNLNNEIGLPKTLLNLSSEHEAAVVEMGMQGIGEIARLCRAARPNIGVITNIGVSHMEQLGSRENILKAKLELAEALPDGAPIVLCGDNDLLKTVRIPRLTMMTYGVDSEEYDLFARDIREDSTSCAFTAVYNEKVAGKPVKQHPISVTLPCIGLHNVRNALAAMLTGKALGLRLAQCAAALEGYAPSGMRQHIVDWKGHIFVEDCYNASPDSMKAALQTLSTYPCKGKRIAVLADMLELGTLAVPSHRAVGKLAAEIGIDRLLCYGSLAKEFVAGAREKEDAKINVLHFESLNALQETLKKELARTPECVVWIKGSHGMHLEKLLEGMYQEGDRDGI